MATCADLTLSIRKLPQGSYTASLTLRDAGGTQIGRAVAPVTLNPTALIEHALDPQQYGIQLTRQIFNLEEGSLRSAWVSARGYAAGAHVHLRVHLDLDPAAEELHGLCWETLLEPIVTGGAWLPFVALREDLYYSRTLPPTALHTLATPTYGDLRAVVVVASPMGLPTIGLAPLAVKDEVDRAMQALSPIPVTIVGAHPRTAAPRATLGAIVDALRDGPHILYLMCHGREVDGERYLLLEEEDGTIARVATSDLAAAIANLSRRPNLVILASCNSAGQSHDDRTLKAPGPQLARMGVAAALAMQGPVNVATLGRLMPAFFRELHRHGQVDRALVVARAALRADQTWWMPVLFMRVHDGRIWEGTPPPPTPPTPPVPPTPPAPPASLDLSPFTYGRPVDPRLFVGRAHERMVIRQRIGPAAGDCLSLIGLRRSGKSSLLLYIEQRMAEFCPDPTQHPLVVRLDLQDINPPSPDAISEELRAQIEEQTGHSPWPPGTPDRDRAIRKGLRELKTRRRLIVLIDEYESLRKNIGAFQDWGGTWRSRITDGLLTMVIASLRSLRDTHQAWGEEGSPLENYFIPLYLGRMPPDEWQALVRRGYAETGRTLDAAGLALIDELSGGLPYYVQMAAHLLWIYTDPELVREQFRHQSLELFRRLWENLSKAEQEALLYYAGMSRAKPLLAYRDTLRRYGVLRLDDRLFSSAFAIYLQNS